MIHVDDLLGARILIVDDEPANVRLLERVLQSAGFGALRSTTDAREVLGLVDEFQPDAILLDLHMPHMDGFLLLEALAASAPPDEYRPVLVLTADCTPEARHRALSGGAKDFVTKPFDRTEVLARTRNLLETRLLHRALQQANSVLEQRIVYQALHDSLTGLANRALFRQRVEHAAARAARGDRIAVLFLDLDNFKAVNDSLGHAEGDRLLEAVAARLLQATRGCDTVARLGGDEFGVLLEGLVREADALVVVDRISSALRRPVRLQGREVMVSASIGVAHVEVGQDVEQVLRNADLAMYRAKAAGRGGHQVFEPGMHAAVLQRLELEADLRRAVERGELQLVYQPIVELDGGRTTGVEALVRWQHPSRGLVAPPAFIPLAEETGLIVPIGRWVLAEACRQARRWQLDAPDNRTLTLSVNISGRQLLDPALTGDVATALADSGLDPALLTLEITESVLMQDTEATLATLHQLKTLGVRLAIDDFGTGYSSLSYLQRFPIDVLKIDKAFIDGVARGGSDAVLARTIVTLAGMLQLTTVAEGVEHAEQHSHLLALGCARGQGYLFARPLAADDVSRFLLPAAP
ncbi:MAG TPA: EAL domain-containing protein [Gemmatimonadaceae bacterium]|nr:EAL domain-containing protein [Gemmatimonadaceae bacterium]